MSHLTQIKTNIIDSSALTNALTSLNINWEYGPTKITSFYGKNQTVDILIKQKNNFNMGFIKQNEEYQLVGDLQYWDNDYTVESFLDQLKQQYAYQIIMRETEDKGFEKLQEKCENGTIKLVVQRWRY